MPDCKNKIARKAETRIWSKYKIDTDMGAHSITAHA